MALVILLVTGRNVVVAADPRASIVERSILAGEVVTISAGSNVGAAALGQSAGAGRELGRDGGLGSHPVGESLFAILDDGLARLITVIRRAGLTGGDGSVVNELQQVFPVAGNDGDLFAVLAERVKLVGISGLDLLAGDVRQLSLGDKGLGLGADKLLLEDNNLGRVGLLVLELGDLVDNLLLSYCLNTC